MASKLHVELDLKVVIDSKYTVLEKYISEVVSDNKREFYELMNRVCLKYDMRAELQSDTFEVEEVCINGSTGIISVIYDWDAYYGCKDMCGGDRIEDEWNFKLLNSKIIFDLELPEITRYDEI